MTISSVAKELNSVFIINSPIKLKMNFILKERNGLLQQSKMDFCNMSILLLSFKGYKNTKEDYVF